jgi:epoxyqueuosine reductase
MIDAAVIVDAARGRGFHRAAIVPVEPARRTDVLAAWLAADRHGVMAYLADPRGDPRALLPDARTLVVVAHAYDRATPDGLVALRGTIARYARGDDYHIVVRDKLVGLADDIARAIGRPVAARPCVDSAPIMEREYAERGGLGFIAKNTMLIAPGLGSYVVLGELLLDVDAAPTGGELQKPRCGSCRACLDACPTGAFVDAYVLDARRCISYLTIETDGWIPRELRAAIGTWVFGCDVCQEVCPFNAGAAPAGALPARDVEHATPDLIRLASLGQNQMRRFVRRTALRRAPRDQLLRNVAVALGNTGDARAIPALERLLGERSPIVRGHAAWSLGELGAAAILAAARARETDDAVLAEIDHGAARASSRTT